MMRSALPLWAGIVLFCVAPALSSEFQVMDRLAVSGPAVFNGTATVAAGLTAASGTFTASGAAQYSVETASGIKVYAGGVAAPFFSGDGSALTGIVANDSSRVSKSGDGMSGPLTLSNSTLTVTGDAFSVGGTTLAASEGRIRIGASAYSLSHALDIQGETWSRGILTGRSRGTTADGADDRVGYFLRRRDNADLPNNGLWMNSNSIGTGTEYWENVVLGAGSGSGNLVFKTQEVERMRIVATGNVGIGTANPGVKFEIAGTPPNNRIRIKRADSSQAAGGIEFVGSDDATDWAIGTNMIVGNAVEFNEGATPRMAILTGGNVGIGTTSPAARLHIAGNVRLDDGSNHNSVSGGIGGTNSIIFRDNNFGGMTFGTTERYQWQVSGVTKMVMDNSGNVGIGTVSPGSPLTVRGATDNTLQIESAGGTYNWNLYSNEGNGSLYFHYKNTADSKFRFQADGAAYAESGPWTTGGVDFAEYIEQMLPDELQSADLVCLAGARKVRKCLEAENPIGVVSASPGFVGGQDKTDRRRDTAYALVGLTGQLPVRVTRDVKTGEALAPSGNARIIAMEDGRAGGLVWALVR